MTLDRVFEEYRTLSSLGFGIAVEPHDVLVIGQDQFLPLARDIV